MAESDDFDSLLDEIIGERETESPAKCSQSIPINAVAQQVGNARDRRPDGLDDLLNELGDMSPPMVAVKTAPAVRSNPSLAGGHERESSGKAKCSTVWLSGSNDEAGKTIGQLRRACDRLRCTKCDFRCLSFPNNEWNDRSDYLFFRNHMPDRDKLQDNLVRAKGSIAYCCQCSWQSVTKAVDVRHVQNLKWVCGGH